jgi:hypothetical protein
MFEPGLADLFEAVVVIGPAAHPVEILWDNRMIGLRQRKPVQWLVAVVTRGRSNSQPHEISITSVLRHFRQVTNDHIGPGHQRWCFATGCALQGRHDHGSELAVNDCLDLDRLHGRSDRNFSNRSTDV